MRVTLIDIEFLDGNILKDCVIFKNSDKGEFAINNESVIADKFMKMPSYSKTDGWIYFQNKYINGTFHVENVLNYKIKYFECIK
jgi:ABC-type phosphate/phosphonate transport system ATPase subunit